jgi:hypothetical protein
VALTSILSLTRSLVETTNSFVTFNCFFSSGSPTTPYRRTVVAAPAAATAEVCFVHSPTKKGDYHVRRGRS